MKNTSLLAASFFLLHVTFAGSFTPTSILYQTTNLNFIAFPQSSIVPGNAVKKKITLKEKIISRLIFKFYKKNTEDTSKKKNRILGIIAASAGGLSLLFFILTLILADGFVMLSWLALSIAAIIFGLTALKRSKKFDDKKDSGRSSGIAGIIMGSIGFIAFVIWIISELNGLA